MKRYIIAIVVFLACLQFQSHVFSQQSSGASGSSSNSSNSSNLSSESSVGTIQFEGIQGAGESTGFLGRPTNQEFLGRTSQVQRRSSGTGSSSRSSSSASSSTRGTSSTTSRSTSSRSTTSRTTSRNRNTMSTGRGNYGIGGTNSNYLQSLSAFSRDDFSGNESTTKAKQEAQTRTRISQLEKRINRSKIQPLIPISVEITDSTAVLRGVVKNEYQRRLAEQYVRLEPGILTVQNELVCSQELNISLPEEGKD